MLNLTVHVCSVELKVCLSRRESPAAVRSRQCASRSQRDATRTAFPNQASHFDDERASGRVQFCVCSLFSSFCRRLFIQCRASCFGPVARRPTCQSRRLRPPVNGDLWSFRRSVRRNGVVKSRHRGVDKICVCNYRRSRCSHLTVGRSSHGSFCRGRLKTSR